MGPFHHTVIKKKVGILFTLSPAFQFLSLKEPVSFFFLIYLFIVISWKLITLQYCSGLCHTLTWISLGYTCIPHPYPPSHLGTNFLCELLEGVYAYLSTCSVFFFKNIVAFCTTKICIFISFYFLEDHFILECIELLKIFIPLYHYIALIYFNLSYWLPDTHLDWF